MAASWVFTMKFRLKSLLLAMTLTVAWCALARLHLGWALFGLICTPVILLTVSIAKSHRLRFAKIAVMIPCLAVVYLASYPPAITMRGFSLTLGTSMKRMPTMLYSYVTDRSLY